MAISIAIIMAIMAMLIGICGHYYLPVMAIYLLALLPVWQLSLQLWPLLLPL